MANVQNNVYHGSQTQGLGQTLSSPRPPCPDSVQDKVNETFHTLSRCRNIAEGILVHLQGAQVTGSQDASPPTPRSLQGDLFDNFQVAHDIENALLRIQDALGVRQ